MDDAAHAAQSCPGDCVRIVQVPSHNAGAPA